MIHRKPIDHEAAGTSAGGSGLFVSLKCKFLRARGRGRSEIRLALFEVHVAKCKRLGILTALLLAAYLVKAWLANR